MPQKHTLLKKPLKPLKPNMLHTLKKQLILKKHTT